MEGSVFQDTSLYTALAVLDPAWVAVPERSASQVLQRVFGPHVNVVEYPYAGTISAFVLTTMATHRVLIIDLGPWTHDPGRDMADIRKALVEDSLGLCEEASNLLTIAATFVEDGYLDRRARQTISPADQFVVALLHLWHDSRMVTGETWDVDAAATMASLVGGDAIIPYLHDVYGLAGRRPHPGFAA